MKRCTLCAVAVLALITCAAGAEEKKAQPELDPKVCQQMVNYVPPAEGGADYKPGVGADGKPVVEADITPPLKVMPDTVSFNVTVDLAKYLALQAPAGLEGEAVIGHIEVDKAGHVTYNGKPLEGEADAALRALCAPEKVEDNKHNQ